MSDKTNPSPLGNVFKEAYKEITAYYDELEGQSSRAAAILAFAALEDALEELLRSRFPPDLSNKKWKRVAGPGPTPFGTFKAKVYVAEAFGFFGPKTRNALELIAQVRNKFAHKRRARDFDHPDVLRACRELADNPVFAYALIDEPPAVDVRWNYMETVKDLTEKLIELRQYFPDIQADGIELLP